MHCGMCLPTCPTYVETKNERNSPRGRIALMRSIADEQLQASTVFAQEMYFCLGCLACETACPAGVDYAHLFELARAEGERSGVLDSFPRRFLRWVLLDLLFRQAWRLRLVGRLIWVYQALGIQTLLRRSKILQALPAFWRALEAKTPAIQRHFTPALVPELSPARGPARYRVGLLSGCVQDLIYSDVNRDTAEVLRANGCSVLTPRNQACCGSLHGHNGEYELSKEYARRLLDLFPVEELDAIITNAAGCGSHLKHYDRLLQDDGHYAEKARIWSAKVKDIHEWLEEIDFRTPQAGVSGIATYHDACHLCHGQKITEAPRDILRKIPQLKVVPLEESMWCCGSAGIYNLIQPEMADKLLQRKLDHLERTGAEIVATGNPGCLLQLQNGLAARGKKMEVVHPVTLLARAYRAEAALN